jgi:S-adenosylmethionine-diacylgycerolhomoserine-N-methlytransferase
MAGATATRPRDTRANAAPARANDAALERYYRLHARIYDATRWSFLFGRSGLLAKLPTGFAPRTVLEIGCGTGAVLASTAARFPGARVVGIDLSPEMLTVAARATARFGDRVSLVRIAYGAPLSTDALASLAPGGFDLVTASYSLTMFGDAYAPAIEAAARDLSPTGRLAVVDFHDSPSPAFRRWMGANHVRMEGQVLAKLDATLAAETRIVSRAYLGLWRYFSFVGRRRGAAE